MLEDKKNFLEYKMKTAITSLLSVSCLAAALVSPLGAKAVSYDINVDKSSGAGLGTPPFGTVTLTQSGSGVDFTVHVNTGFNFVLTGALDEMDFEFNATGIALGDITITQNAPFNLVAQSGTFGGGSVGSFAYGITGLKTVQGNGAPGAFNSDIKFNVANSTVSDFTTANNLSFLFAVDVLSPTGATGPAAARNVPDGGVTAILLGGSLTGIALIGRKKANV